MNQSVDLTHHFLIAMPGLADPNFVHSVTYICEHSEHGAMGIVINRPLDLSLGEVLQQLGLESRPELTAQPVFLGGPVETSRGFVLHSPVGQWGASIAVSEDIAVTTSRDILQALAAGRGPARSLVALGYAGWAAGQLEHEMAANAWLSGPADSRILFDLPPAERWRAAAQSLGVDLSLISSDVGHA